MFEFNTTTKLLDIANNNEDTLKCKKDLITNYYKLFLSFLRDEISCKNIIIKPLLEDLSSRQLDKGKILSYQKISNNIKDSFSFRSSHTELFLRKGFLKICSKFT